MLIQTNVEPGILTENSEGNTEVSKPRFIISNVFDEEMGDVFALAFNQLRNDSQPVIPLNINSDGGDATVLSSILDLIAASQKAVLTFTSSKAYSCGAILLSAGTKGLRFASPNASILIHEASSGMRGKTSEFMNEAKNLNDVNERMMDVLAKNSGKPKSFYRNLIKANNNADLYITPEQALSYGIIDAIAIPEITMNVSATYNISLAGPSKTKEPKNKKGKPKPIKDIKS